MSEGFVTDRMRLEASLPVEGIALAGAFERELRRLGHHGIADRRALLLTLASIAAPTPPTPDLTPPRAVGDDVERAYKDGFVEGFGHRERSEDPLEAVEGAKRGWAHRAAIAALSTGNDDKAGVA